MPHRRNYAHVVDVPFSLYLTRFFQALLAGCLLGLTAYAIAFNDFASVRLSVFASAFALAILGYYLVAVHALPFIYNWLAIIITEFLIIAFYAATFSSLAALYTDEKYSDFLYSNVIIAIVAMSAFAFVTHVITFLMHAAGVVKHRKQGKPLFSPQGRRPTIDMSQA
ncbi:hypothetical protein VHEMI01701 [[Torrubiella] hemipterigena]|uniref:MARVEL domain-containing protein n=1 Tax=[Torrubiella] hemipterigena TaxID=1531966 RepID=A0A0A1T638_9HYPO|nr:hypothetical protein VHEMI01701 [[Torrubiella] hemipterigena]